MKTFKIDRFYSSKAENFITRFGGQHDWVTAPQWPVTPSYIRRLLDEYFLKQAKQKL